MIPYPVEYCSTIDYAVAAEENALTCGSLQCLIGQRAFCGRA